MTEKNDYGAFIVQIMKNLEKNGFPANNVALPLERMYESAYEKGLNFNKVFSFLADRGIYHEKTTEKVIFSATQPSSAEPGAADPSSATGAGDPADPTDQLKDILAGVDLSALHGKSPGDMLKSAMDFLGKLSPEQRTAMERLYGEMSEEQKSDIMKKAREMGLC